MGWLGKVDKWITDRQNREAPTKTKPFSKRRKDLNTVGMLCKSCGHNKMFYKGSTYKCCKCGERISL